MNSGCWCRRHATQWKNSSLPPADRQQFSLQLLQSNKKKVGRIRKSLRLYLAACALECNSVFVFRVFLTLVCELIGREGSLSSLVLFASLAESPPPPPPPPAPPPPSPVTVNNNGKQVEAASSTPAGLELHPVLCCQRRTRSVRAAPPAPPLTCASGCENVQPGGGAGGGGAAAHQRARRERRPLRRTC